jgi:endonuclease/exonuclease/phosphatase family metal-dependent hydrolase
VLDWPRGLITNFAIHSSPLARVASDHLPLVAEVNLKCTLPALR